MTKNKILVVRLRDIVTCGCDCDEAAEIGREAADRIEYLERRLEVVSGYGEGTDGITCRDATIKLQDERIARLTAELGAVRMNSQI